ncbi:LOW QUALITY PROTEIN: transposable element Tcb1 transposase [Elysia marginata]|uniref:Transposable element Tcb1 transposase n=1 Tax=Elysia marginata TaxID=1093978 RepID=A0AAV4I8K8_9GAST|nr:LOW QUALITY PROTEIN: transposable element Tcb1 transposase [Elysia marginata]
MSRLSEVDRHRALGLLQAGLPIGEVSLRMNINRTTIFKLRKRLHETDTRHRHQRTLWAHEHAAWDRIQWRSVVFSDESRFCIGHADGRVLVWRRNGERYQADLGNTTGGWCIFDDVGCYLLQ